MKGDAIQPTWVCHPCGLRWGRREPRPGDVSTYHDGDACGACGAETMTTEPRDFGYLRPGWDEIKEPVDG